MTLRVPVKPELLHWACERAGHDVDAFTGRFPQLPAWAKGAVAPTLKQLEAFAKATHAPIGYFFLPAPPDEPVPIPDFRTIAGRSAARPSPELLDTVYICQQRQEWYRDFARSMRESPLPFVGSARVTSDVIATAADIRRTLGFDLDAQAEMPTFSDALRRFIALTDAAGILVMCNGVVLNNTHRPLNPEEFWGFALADNLAPLVFINGADTKAAQMFTLAHELAHVWLGQSAVSDAQAGRTPTHEVERWCNQVAAELLAPFSAFRTDDEPTRPVISQRFARAVVAGTLEGQTLYRDAYRLLGLTKHAAFENLGHGLGGRAARARVEGITPT